MRDLRVILRVVIGSVWVFHGFVSKVLGWIPRHEQIVGRVLGEDVSSWATPVIGAMEILVGLWVWSGAKPGFCAGAQTAALVVMNTLELIYARDLLVAPLPMVCANALLLAGAWFLALRRQSAGTFGTRPKMPD